MRVTWKIFQVVFESGKNLEKICQSGAANRHLRMCIIASEIFDCVKQIIECRKCKEEFKWLFWLKYDFCHTSLLQSADWL